MFSVWESVVKNVPKHGKSGNGFVLWDKIEKLTYLRRYWTDFKNVDSFETGIFFSNRIQKGGSIVAN